MSGTDTVAERVPWRLLRSGPGKPAWNMAFDEALLAGFQRGDPPILRIYGWRPAGLSLGRFQRADDVAVPAGAVRVRRLTGGAAIHHRSDEVTYAVVAPYALFGGRGPRAAYRAVHGAVAAALADLGVAAADRGGDAKTRPAGRCFAQTTDYDLVAAGRKLVGSAQRRRGRVFLQHGSLPLSPDPEAAGATSVGEVLGRAPARDAVVEALCAAVGARLTERLDAATPGPAERRRAERLWKERYARDAWTWER